MRALPLVLGLVALAGLAAAQESMSDSDFDTAPPSDDAAYLSAEDNMSPSSDPATGDPTLSDSDLATPPVEDDASYMTASDDFTAPGDTSPTPTPAPTPSGTPPPAEKGRTPGFEVAALLAAAVVVAVAARKR